MELRAHVCPAFGKHMAEIRKGESYIIHFFLQLKKKQAEAQQGAAVGPRSHSRELEKLSHLGSTYGTMWP